VRVGTDFMAIAVNDDELNASPFAAYLYHSVGSHEWTGDGRTDIKHKPRKRERGNFMKVSPIQHGVRLCR